MLHPINPYYEKRSHREGWLVMPLIVLSFLVGSTLVIFVGMRLFEMLIHSLPKIDLFFTNLLTR